MFRFFLTKKLFSTESRDVPASDRPNRRMKDRYAFDHKRMTMMSDQDIMVVREVSEAGFSSVVSERTWARMNVGDGYSSRVRLGPDIMEFSIRVAWKDTVKEPGREIWILGFEMMAEEGVVPAAWRRLIRPAAIAGSLQRVDSSFMQQFGSIKAWYHGDEGCDLMIWIDPDRAAPFAWRLSFDSHFVEWRDGSGFETGKTPDTAMSLDVRSARKGTSGDNPGKDRRYSLPEMPLGGAAKAGTQIPAVDHRRLREALDILAASNVDEAPALIRLLEGELANHGQRFRSNIR